MPLSKNVIVTRKISKETVETASNILYMKRSAKQQVMDSMMKRIRDNFPIEEYFDSEGNLVVGVSIEVKQIRLEIKKK